MHTTVSRSTSIVIRFIPASIVAIGLILCALILAHFLARGRNGNDTIQVIGSARKPIRSDLIIWRGRITQTAPDVGKAYAQLTTNTGKVQAYLTRKGIRQSEITLLSVNIQTLYAQTLGANEPPVADTSGMAIYHKAVGYRLTQELEVRSNQVDSVDHISRQSTEVISQGVPFQSERPLYLYTKLSSLKVSMQAEAAQDARARASQIAQSSGCHLDTLRFARMNVPQITPLYSATASDGGVDDTSSIDKQITAIVVEGYSIR